MTNSIPIPADADVAGDYSFRQELREAEERLHALRNELSRLCGYYKVDNAVPLFEVEKLVY